MRIAHELYQLPEGLTAAEWRMPNDLCRWVGFFALRIVVELLNQLHSLTDITAIGEPVPSATLAATLAVDHGGISALRARRVGNLPGASVILSVPRDSSKPNLAAKSAITTVKLVTVRVLMDYILGDY